MELMKVGAKTNPGNLAGAIAEAVRNAGGTEMTAIGAAAVNQAVKGVAIARGFLASQGVEICLLPGFRTMEVEGKECTVLIMEVRKL